ncbi:MAG: amidinotransferase [Chitinophagaceae bacterium]|nr:amidinotransferase [Chitinophagaceae bacterium]
MPLATTILMIRPAAFGYNEETAANNFFQNNSGANRKELQQKAIAEFDNMVQLLRNNDVDVLVVDDTAVPPKPDAIFPNNWLSTSPEGKVIIYPMYSSARRNEKRDDIIELLTKNFETKDVQDWGEYEAEDRYLEGTGSMIIDHDNKLIYACLSERTNPVVLEKFASANGYQAIVFLATDKSGNHIYHTNVMMALGEKLCVLCEESIEEEWELIAVRQLLDSTGHSIVAITREQMHRFAGNMLELKNKKGEHLLILSQAAYNSLRPEQKQKIESFARLLPVAIPTIEQTGGGSVRCMMAEIFLEKRG